MQFQTVAILGAGAIGGYFVWGLSERLGENLWVVAEGERAERLRRDGLTINGQRYALHVRTPAEARGADLLLVATKYGALRGALDAVRTVADDHTTVMSLLNGVDSEEILSTVLPRRQLLYALMKIASERRGNDIRFDGPSTYGLAYGEPDTPEVTPRMQAVETLLQGTSLHYHPVPDILQQIWWKYAINCSRNQPQAILNVGVGAYLDSEHVAALATGLWNEVVAVAAAKGVDISMFPQGAGTPAAKRARYSTLQDLDAHRTTEVEMFGGAMMRLGAELGIAVPYSTFAYHAIKALEEKNSGTFDY